MRFVFEHRIVPYVGLVSIWISEVPWLKPALVGALGLYALLS